MPQPSSRRWWPEAIAAAVGSRSGETQWGHGGVALWPAKEIVGAIR